MQVAGATHAVLVGGILQPPRHHGTLYHFFPYRGPSNLRVPYGCRNPNPKRAQGGGGRLSGGGTAGLAISHLSGSSKSQSVQDRRMGAVSGAIGRLRYPRNLSAKPERRLALRSMYNSHPWPALPQQNPLEDCYIIVQLGNSRWTPFCCRLTLEIIGHI